MKRLAFAVGSALICFVAAYAKPHYAEAVDPETGYFLSHQQRPDHYDPNRPYEWSIDSCCGPADAYEADDFVQEGPDFYAIVTRGDEDFPAGTKVLIPPEKIIPHAEPPNKTGHGWVWMTKNPHPTVFCYIPPAGV